MNAPWLPVALVAAGVAGCGSGTGGARPNVILICVDTLRADRLGYHGYERDTSPFVDGLSARGASFLSCFSTYPQTAASVASLFTSLLPSTHKAVRTGLALGDEPETLAEVFARAGYRTAGVATNPHLSPGLGYEQGFERYVYIAGKDEELSQYGDGEPLEDVELVRLRTQSTYGSGAAVNRAAFEWLSGEERGAPFFLYLHYMDVHSPYKVPKPYHMRFVTERGRYVYRNGLPKEPPRPQDVRYCADLYDSQIPYLDHLLEELLSFLEQRGLLENTYLALTSDHGDEFMEHGGFGHGETLYREMTHVPLLLLGPGIGPSAHDSVVSTIDVYPTLCELAGVEPPPGLQGTSLVPVLRGAGARPPAVLSECDAARDPGGRRGPQFSLTTNEWRLLHRPDTGASQLFRTRDDPREAVDHAAGEREVVAELLGRAEELRRAAQERGATIRAREVELDATTLRELEALGYAR